MYPAFVRRALAIYEKSLGPEHPNVAAALNNLANLLQATNRLAEAEPLMRRAAAAVVEAAEEKRKRGRG
jgi:tetratricopeptide repeat protein